MCCNNCPLVFQLTLIPWVTLLKPLEPCRDIGLFFLTYCLFLVRLWVFFNVVSRYRKCVLVTGIILIFFFNDVGKKRWTSSCIFGNRVSSSDVYYFITHFSSYMVCLCILGVCFVFKENNAKFWIIHSDVGWVFGFLIHLSNSAPLVNF